MSIGNKLKKARKSRGLSLEDIKNKSKIKKSYLKALENDNFEKLPGEVYTKVYIRGYAKIVGIDPKIILSEYENLKNNDKNMKSSNKPQSKKNDKENNNFFNKDKIFRGLLGIILILIIVLMSYNVFFRTDQNQNNTVKSNQTTEVVQEDNSKESNNNNENPKNESNTEEISSEELETDLNNNESITSEKNNVQNLDNSNNSTANTKNNSDNNNNEDSNNQEQKPLVEDKSKEIKILASDKSWLQVNVDGELKFQGFINEDETMTHSGNETIRLKIGNGIAVKVEFDGEKLGPFGKRGEVIIKEFDI